MNSKNLFNIRRVGPYLMDPTSDRYRVCPNDGVEFMASHRSEKFCCDQCADEFHNTKKRLEAEKVQFEKELDLQEALSDKIFNRLNKDGLQHNLYILDGLNIVAEGLIFSIDWLHSMGFDFEVYDSREKMHRSNPESNSHYIVIGEYKIFRKKYGEVLIIKSS